MIRVLRRADAFLDASTQSGSPKKAARQHRGPSRATDSVSVSAAAAAARRVEAVTKVSAAWLLGLYEEGPRPAERDRDLRKYTAWDSNPEPTD